MTAYKYIALTCAVPGREQDFDTWYNGRHLIDVAAVPGVKSAVRFEVRHCVAEDGPLPNWRSLAIYEIETDGDPQEVLDRIRQRHGTELMPATDSLERRGMVQIIAAPVPFKPVGE